MEFGPFNQRPTVPRAPHFPCADAAPGRVGRGVLRVEPTESVAADRHSRPARALLLAARRYFLF